MFNLLAFKAACLYLCTYCACVLKMCSKNVWRENSDLCKPYESLSKKTSFGIHTDFLNISGFWEFCRIHEFFRFEKIYINSAGWEKVLKNTRVDFN